MKILIIEDEPELAADIGAYLSAQDYLCEYASTWAQAKEKVELYRYECILLDLMLPGGDGLDILDTLKDQGQRDGVIIISAKNDYENKIRGLHAGADDYLAKPFHLPELAARIYSVIRRRSFGNQNNVVQNELKVDLSSRVVTVNGTLVSLTRKELDLLLYFIGNKNRVISKSALAEHLSGDIADMFDNHDFVYAHVKNLKKKLTEAGYSNYLKTIYATGYKWEG
jgi:DNA-binding response OmpR family regulator